MTENEYKRSKEPIFWGLFGFGGMVISFAFPALLICMIIAGITGDFSHFKIVDIMKHWWGAGALFLIIMGTVFHCVHRIYFSLHDLKINTGLAGQIAFYSFAVLLSLAALVGLGKVYFG